LTGPADQLEGAGGHAEYSSRVCVVVNDYGPTDLTESGWGEALENVFHDLLGGGRDQLAEAYKAASPITYVRKGAPPVLTIHGTRDTIVPYEQAEKITSALRRVGGEAQLITLEGSGHGDVWGPKEFLRHHTATLEFFDRHLKDR
jgi:dipeptidyl aminopeptidase/acylaminoacyl peptidase